MNFEVQGTVVPSGKKHRGYVEVGETSTHTVKIPYIVINGIEEGKVLTILGGVHALECAPVEAIFRLVEDINPEQVKGTIILVPIVNTEGFQARHPYHNQLDHLNQNKVFPGNPETSLTNQVAYRAFEHFVSKSDVLIDAHSADLGEDVTRGIFIYKTQNEELLNKMIELASLYNPMLIETTSIAGNTGEAVSRYQIPCLMIESGTPYPIREKDVKYHYEGAINVMKYLKILQGEPTKYSPKIDPPSQRVWSKKGGVWRRNVEAGQLVNEGENLGMVCSLTGEILQQAIAPCDGVISFLRIHYSVNSGDTLFWVTNV